MKAFTVLIILFFLIFLIASTGIAQVDLTPDTPAGTVNQPVLPLTSEGENVIQIQGNTTTQTQPLYAAAPQAAPQNVVPVTGSCTDPYTVQPGDILSVIAEKCETTVAAIRLANRDITNANMIYPGQLIRIPVDGASGQAQPLPVVPQSAATPVAAAPSVTVPLPVTGPQPLVQAGTHLEVKAIDYPPNTPVSIAIGPQTQGYTVIASGITDANGSLTTTVIAPNAPDSQTAWVVVVATNGATPIQAMSKPFYIAGSQ